MPSARAAVSERAQPAQGPELAPTGTYADGAIAARDALAILKFGEAPRVGVLGDSGTGKSFALKWLIAAYLEMQPRGVAIVVDDKPRPRFPGQFRRDIADLRRRPPDPKGPRVIVLRGDPFAVDGDVDPETVAEFQWEQSTQKKRPTVGVYDELGKAADGGQWKAGNKSRISWAFGKGRDADVASFWGDQETEGVPRQPFNQSSSLFVFRMRGNPLRLLKARGYLDGGAEEVIPRLHGEPLPPAQRGTFLHLRRSQPWDGVIYKFRA